MKIVLIEDETPALTKLEALIAKYDPFCTVEAKIKSVKEGLGWFGQVRNIDLILADIQLTDGLSFEIFEQLKIQTPIVFITAFDQYAIEAFKLNSIDYLLKPVTLPQLSQSLDKFKSFSKHLPNESNEFPNWQQLKDALTKPNNNYKTRFGIKVGENLKTITTEDIVCFYADGRTVYLTNKENRNYIVDSKLEIIESQVNPKHFFRANRTFIVNIDYIKNVSIHSNSRYKLNMQAETTEEIIVSRSKAQQFKEWFDGC